MLTSTQTHIHMHIHTYIYIYIYVFVINPASFFVNLSPARLPCIRAHTHTHIYTYMHMHIHIRSCTHTHTHTYICIYICFCHQSSFVSRESMASKVTWHMCREIYQRLAKFLLHQVILFFRLVLDLPLPWIPSIKKTWGWILLGVRQG